MRAKQVVGNLHKRKSISCQASRLKHKRRHVTLRINCRLSWISVDDDQKGKSVPRIKTETCLPTRALTIFNGSAYTSKSLTNDRILCIRHRISSSLFSSENKISLKSVFVLRIRFMILTLEPSTFAQNVFELKINRDGDVWAAFSYDRKWTRQRVRAEDALMKASLIDWLGKQTWND